MAIRKPGIAARLAISFAAVAVLAVAANLIVEGKVSVLQTTEVRNERPAPSPVPLSKPTPAPTVAQTVAPAPIRPPFPSTDLLLRALDRVDRAVDASAEGDITELTARFPKLAAELDHAATEFAAAASAAGESPPPRFMTTVRSHRQRGADLVKLAATRGESMAEYSKHFEQLNTRVKKSPVALPPSMILAVCRQRIRWLCMICAITSYRTRLFRSSFPTTRYSLRVSATEFLMKRAATRW